MGQGVFVMKETVAEMEDTIVSEDDQQTEKLMNTIKERMFGEEAHRLDEIHVTDILYPRQGVIKRTYGGGKSVV